MGAAKRFSARISADEDTAIAVSAALAAAEEFAADANLGEGAAARLAVVVEELVSNAVRHGADGRETEIGLLIEGEGDAIRIAFEDDGVAFDPTAQRDFNGPDPQTGGGVGLALVSEWASEFAYSRADGRNRVTLLLANAP